MFLYLPLQVLFKNPVSILDNPKINQWLTLVEKEMRTNLAVLLAQAFEEAGKFYSETIDSKQYIDWVDRYQAQLVVLVAQILWSNGVESALQSLQSQPNQTEALEQVQRVVEATLNVLADSVLQDQPPIRRKKLENLVCLRLSLILLLHKNMPLLYYKITKTGGTLDKIHSSLAWIELSQRKLLSYEDLTLVGEKFLA